MSGYAYALRAQVSLQGKTLPRSGRSSSAAESAAEPHVQTTSPRLEEGRQRVAEFLAPVPFLPLHCQVPVLHDSCDSLVFKEQTFSSLIGNESHESRAEATLAMAT